MLTISATYNLFFWPIAILCLLKGAYTYDWALTRLSLVAVIGELVMRAYDFFVDEKIIAAFSFGVIYLSVYVGQCVLVTVKPPSKYCAVGGGIFLAGATTSVVYIFFRKGYDADVLFWYNNVILGWILILLLAWGLLGDGMQRAIYGFGGRAASLAIKPRRNKLAE